jgi:hypothetical protein
MEVENRHRQLEGKKSPPQNDSPGMPCFHFAQDQKHD